MPPEVENLELTKQLEGYIRGLDLGRRAKQNRRVANGDPCTSFPSDWGMVSPAQLFGLIACGVNMTIQGFGPIIAANPVQKTVTNSSLETMTVTADVPAKGRLGGVGLGMALGIGVAGFLAAYWTLRR